MKNKQFLITLGVFIGVPLLVPFLLGVEFIGTQVNSRDIYLVSTHVGNHCRAEVYDANTGQHIPRASMSGMCTILKDGRTGMLWYGKGRISGQINYHPKFD